MTGNRRWRQRRRRHNRLRRAPTAGDWRSGTIGPRRGRNGGTMKPITADELSRYLATRMPSWPELEIRNLHRLPMGASRETYRFDLDYRGADGGRVTERLILRRDPPASNV